MDSHNTVGIDNETRLWHGTSTDAIDKINHNGFNRSYCGKNGECIHIAKILGYNWSYKPMKIRRCERRILAT